MPLRLVNSKKLSKLIHFLRLWNPHNKGYCKRIVCTHSENYYMLWNFTFASSFPSHMFVSIVVVGVSQSTGQLNICWFWPPQDEDLYVLSYQKFFWGNTACFPPVISSLKQLTQSINLLHYCNDPYKSHPDLCGSEPKYSISNLIWELGTFFFKFS